MDQRVALKVERVFRTSAAGQPALDAHDDVVVACAGSGALRLDPATGKGISPLYTAPPRPRKPLPWEPSSRDGQSLGISEPVPSSGSPTRSASPQRVQTRANAASCVAVSSAGFVAVGESGYQPRIVLYDRNEGVALAAVKEHQYGVCHLAFSPSGTLMVSLGTPNDGYIYVWYVDTTRRRFLQYASNRCISDVRQLLWISETQFVTVGVRHVRVWTLPLDKPIKDSLSGGVEVLGGRNVVLRELVDATFLSICAFPGGSFVVGTASGDIYRLLPDVEPLVHPGFPVNSIVRDIVTGHIFVGTVGGVLEYTASWDLVQQVTAHPSIGLVCTPLAVLILTGEGQVASVDTMVNDSCTGVPPRGAHLRSMGSEALWWSGYEVGVISRDGFETLACNDDEVTAAYCAAKHSEVIIGTVMGDLRVGNNEFRAHNGPVSDIDITAYGRRMLSAGRDRCIQIWVLNDNSPSWELEQTIPVSNPVLHARFITMDDADTVLACTTSGKTLQFFRSAGVASPFSPTKNVVLKSAPLDVYIYRSQVVVSTNDRQITAYDDSGRQTAAFRPCDAHGEAVTLSHIQVVVLKNTPYLMGSASDKSIAIYTFPDGVWVGSEWGHSEVSTGLAWLPDTEELVSAADGVIFRKPEFITPSSPPRPTLRALAPRSPIRPASPVRSPSRSTSPLRKPAPHTPPGSPPRARSRVLAAPGSPTPRPTQRGRSAVSPVRLDMNIDSRPLKLATPPVAPEKPSQQLISALEKFNAEASPESTVDADTKAKLRSLLLQAVHKVDGLALVQEFSDRVLDVVRQRMVDISAHPNAQP